MTSPPPPDSAAASHDPPAPSRRRLPWQAWAVFGGALLVLAVAYLHALRQARGEYVLSPDYLGRVTLFGTAIPRAELSLGGPHGPHHTLYYVGRGGVRFPNGRRLLSRSASPGRFELRELRAGGSVELAERYPLGAIDLLEQARFHPGSVPPRDLVRHAEHLRTEFPDFVMPRFWLIAALCLDGRINEARTELDASRDVLAADSLGRDGRLAFVLECDLEAAAPAARAAFDDYIDRFPPYPAIMPHSLDDTLAWIRGAEGRDAPRRLTFDQRYPHGGLLLSAVRAACASSIFAMADGRRDDADGLLLGAFIVSADVRGVAIHPYASILDGARERVLRTLADVCLHAERTPEELERLWTRAEAVWAKFPPLDSEEIVRRIDSTAATMADLRAHLKSASAAGAGTWLANDLHRVCHRDSLRELLREGIRARHALWTRGAWPAIDATGALDGDLLASVAPPVDPFADPPRRLRARMTQQTLVIWSVGPDGRDDGGLVRFDPSAGWTSRGDVVLEIAREPRYRFPSEPGYEYGGRAEFNDRYPDGLPRDPCLETTTTLQFTSDGTNLIWSFGPDREEKHHARRAGPGRQVEDPYDPTNGANSRGDLYRKLNFRAAP